MIRKGALTSRYVELLGQFPLRLIKTREQHAAAMAVLEKLAIQTKLSNAESDYFDVLSVLVEDYERSIIGSVGVSPDEALLFLIEQQNLTYREIANYTGMQV